MSAVTTGAPSFHTLLRLGRISNIPTVWTNVIAGAVIAGGTFRVADVVLIGVAMSAFYVGGMYLNDFFDREIDARERPGRPINAGEITAGAVSTIGFGLLGMGVLLLAPFGLPAVAWGVVLAGAIVLYDSWHKGNTFSPVIMGLCRGLVYLGAGAAMSGGISGALILGAFALACHVVGLTYAAKQENLNQIGRLWPLAILAVPMLIALPVITSSWLIVLSFSVLALADVFALRLLVRRSTLDAVPRAVSSLIAAICLVDALALALAGGSVLLVFACALGYLLTRLFQKFIPGT